MLDDVYGTRPDYLPRFMVQVVAVNRRPAWAARPGVELLDLDAHLRYERESLGRFPNNSDGTIDWDVVADDAVLYSAEWETVELGTVLRDSVPNAGDLVFLWGNPIIPSVRMAFETADSNLSAIVESKPEFWVFSPEGQILLELTFAGLVTVARVPNERE